MPPRDAKRAMARALTAHYHGEEGAAAAEERFDTLHVRHELPDEIEDFAFTANGGAVHLPALLADAFGVSRSEARRLLGQAGVKLDGEALVGDELDLPAERLDGAVIQLGKRRHKRLRRRYRRFGAPGPPRCYTGPSRLRRSGIPTPEGHGL